MHPKNPFIENYDFEVLMRDYPPLDEFVFVNQYGTSTIKFADKRAVKALNTALLKSKYGIDWDIPEKNLCPPIPGRLDYLLHIADLIPNKELSVLDIGTGANLIYPILAVSHFNWKCVASEVDDESLKNAQSLIEQNASLSGIKLRKQISKANILKNVIQEGDVFDVVVCNPPFYKNAEEAHENNARKVRNLKLKEEDKLNFGGLSNELWYRGGEEAFILKMVEESVSYKDQVDWFTSLVSKKENLKNIKRAINKIPGTEYKLIDMGLGNKSTRFIAWTFKNSSL